MKKATYLLCGISMSAFLSTSSFGALVHHYTFDDLVTGGNATDSVGGATGNWDGDAGANVAVAGVLGTASQTNDENGGNGQEHYTTSTLSGLNGASALSISLWYNANVDQNNNSTYNGLFMTRVLTSSFGGGGENWGIAYEDNAAPRHIDWRIDGAAGTETDDIADDTNWHHVVYVWDGTAGNISLYFDGSLLASQGAATGTITDGASWEIGNDTCCGSREFTGTLDDIAVFDNPLDANFVSALYQGGAPTLNAAQVPEPGSVALFGLASLTVLLRRRR